MKVFGGMRFELNIHFKQITEMIKFTMLMKDFAKKSGAPDGSEHPGQTGHLRSMYYHFRNTELEDLKHYNL